MSHVFSWINSVLFTTNRFCHWDPCAGDVLSFLWMVFRFTLAPQSLRNPSEKATMSTFGSDTSSVPISFSSEVCPYLATILPLFFAPCYFAHSHDNHWGHLPKPPKSPEHQHRVDRNIYSLSGTDSRLQFLLTLLMWSTPVSISLKSEDWK